MPLLALLAKIPTRWLIYAGLAIAVIAYVAHVHHAGYVQGRADQVAEDIKAHSDRQATLDKLTGIPSPYVEQYNALDAALRIPMPAHTVQSPCAPAPSELVKRTNEHNHAHH